MPELNALVAKSYDQINTYGDRVHFVHIYVIEPHPKSPDPSPYNGRVSATQYSTKSQPKTYQQRVANATDMVPLLEGNQLLLVDDLVPGSLTNPLWCTYGPAPNCAFLIRQDGILDTVQKWVDVDEMETAINALLGSAASGNF